MHFLLSKENIFYAKLKEVHCLVNELHDQEPDFQSILTNHKCCHKFIRGSAFFKERFCVQQMMRASEFKMIIEKSAIEVKKRCCFITVDFKSKKFYENIYYGCK